MFAITGITGQVGGEVARNLLSAHQTVRGVVRDVGKGRAWAELGCHLVSADINDAAALTTAFKGVDGVFDLVPASDTPIGTNPLPEKSIGLKTSLTPSMRRPV